VFCKAISAPVRSRQHEEFVEKPVTFGNASCERVRGIARGCA
jgi:hypothetical protein